MTDLRDLGHTACLFLICSHVRVSIPTHEDESIAT